MLAGLGIYADAAGPVGNFLEAVSLGLFGLAGYVVPTLFAWFGLLIVVGRPSPEVGRIAVGSVLLGAGVLGTLHLATGQPGPAEGIRELWHAGGLVGWAIGAPLTAAVSVWGATAVGAALIALGLGPLVIQRADRREQLLLDGGFMTVKDDNVIVLAEYAVLPSELEAAEVDAEIERLRASLQQASEDEQLRRALARAEAKRTLLRV